MNNETSFIFSKRVFNPLFWILLTAIQDPKLRYIFVYGGSSAAKTYSICQVLTWMAMKENASSMVLRKFSVDIEDSVWADFKEVIQRFKMDPYADKIRRHLRFATGAQARFRGLDKSEKIKGLKGFKYIYYNEFSLFLEADFNQGRKRMRGVPGQKMIADWNPISDQHWIKRHIIDRETWQAWNPNMSLTTHTGAAWSFPSTEMPYYSVPAMTKQPKWRYLNADHSSVQVNSTGDMLLVRTTYLDNWWVIGRPDGRAGFRDEHVMADFERDRIHNPNDYRIYALGEWGRARTGGEFLKSFNEGKQVKPLSYDPTNVIRVSLDNNVQPYISATIWQINTTAKRIRQISEICSRSPDNNAPRAARQLARYLNRIRYEQPVYIHGDPSASAKSTIDENNASFFDKYMAELRSVGYIVVNQVARSAPAVAMSGAFLNEIYEQGFEGWEIEVDVRCRESINDYCSVLEDKDGKILKKRITDRETGLSYEEHGHLTDTQRYLVCSVLSAEYRRFKARHSRLFGVPV